MKLPERLPERLRPVVRDTTNVLRHGRAAPRYAERIWVDPRDVDELVPLGRRLHSGRVLGGDWDRDRLPVDDHVKVRACRARFAEGVTWEETGITAELERLIAERGRAKDGLRDRADIEARYRRVDALAAQLRREGRLRTRAEVEPRAFRELGGVLINLDRHARPVAGGGGWHRLALARLLGFTTIPAQVGIVHREALDRWRDAVAARIA